MDTSSKFCPKCGSAVDSNAVFCQFCGAQLVHDDTSEQNTCNYQPDDTTPSSEGDSCSDSLNTTATGSKVNISIKKALLLAVSVLLAILAFLPIMSVKIDNDEISEVLGEDVEIKLSYSAVNSIVYFFDSLKNLEVDELQDESIYDDVLDVMHDMDNIIKSYDDNASKLSTKDQRKLAKLYSELLVYTQRLQLRSEETAFCATRLLAALLSLVYLCAVLGLLLFSVISIFSDKHSSLVRLLAFLPSFSILLYATLKYSYAAVYTSQYSYGAYENQIASSPTAALVMSVIFPVLFIIYTAVDRHLALKLPSLDVKKLACDGILLLVSVVMMFSLFIPITSFEVKTVFKGKTNPSTASTDIDIVFFNSYCMTEDTVDDYKDMTSKEFENAITYNFSSLSNYTKRGFIRGESAGTNSKLMTLGAIAYSSLSPTLLSAIPLLMLIFGAVSAILLGLMLEAVMTGGALKYIDIKKGLLIAVGAIVLLATVVLLIVYTVTTNANFSYVDISGDIRVKFNAMTVIAGISLLLHCLVSALAQKR